MFCVGKLSKPGDFLALCVYVFFFKWSSFQTKGFAWSQAVAYYLFCKQGNYCFDLVNITHMYHHYKDHQRSHSRKITCEYCSLNSLNLMLQRWENKNCIFLYTFKSSIHSIYVVYCKVIFNYALLYNLKQQKLL